MITIKSHIEELLKKEPFLIEEYKKWTDQYIRFSQEKLNQELSKKVGKKLNPNAIIMSVKRMEIDQLNKARPLKKQLKNIGDLTVKIWPN